MRTKVAGSSTACVMQLDQAKRMLVAANLVGTGDAGGRRSIPARAMQLDQAKRMLVAANLVSKGGARGEYSFRQGG